jgi:integrase
MFWSHDGETQKQKSLRTKDRREAERVLHAMNEPHQQASLNLQIGRAYLAASNPQMMKRTWQEVMDEIIKVKKAKKAPTVRRWGVAVKDKAFDQLRNLPLLETRSEHFLQAMENGKVSTNIYLRRIHNFALGMNWLPVAVVPKCMWPSFQFKDKRAITQDEHKAIVARETNAERRAFYQLAWHIGASQSDIAFLDAENIDWTNRVISYERIKTGELASIRFGSEVEAILRSLPEVGPLFPYLRTVRAGDRATEFKQRCQGLNIEGVSLHSYRYAWAERARKSGYPERFAQDALGHNSQAVHRAYAKRAKVIVPALEEYEADEERRSEKIVAFAAAR